VKLRKHVGLYEKQRKTNDDDDDDDYYDLFNDASNNLDYKVKCVMRP
jgi:hypothetical protein